jgi:hypothetical protein
VKYNSNIEILSGFSVIVQFSDCEYATKHYLFFNYQNTSKNWLQLFLVPCKQKNFYFVRQTTKAFSFGRHIVLTDEGGKKGSNSPDEVERVHVGPRVTACPDVKYLHYTACKYQCLT